MWSVFMCLTVMLGFARRNDAAISKIKIRMIFVPLHMIYLSLLLWAVFDDEITHCRNEESNNYPLIFRFQYSVFFLTYIIFVFLHKNDYMMSWHESIKHIDLQNELTEM